MGYSDQEQYTLHLKVAGGAERTLSPQIPTLPGCRYGSHVPEHTKSRSMIRLKTMRKYFHHVYLKVTVSFSGTSIEVNDICTRLCLESRTRPSQLQQQNEATVWFCCNYGLLHVTNTLSGSFVKPDTLSQSYIHICFF